MATAAFERVDPFLQWKNGIQRADSAWDAHDADIRRIVGEYNGHLRSTPYHRPLDWRLVKALL